MFLHVIARSGATWQSASPAVAQSRKQRLRRIRESVTNLPWHHAVATAGSCMFLHVIARSGATWQSASPAVAQSRKQRLRRIRESVTNLPKQQPTCQASLRGKRIATPVCALVRNDMLKAVTRLRVQERLARKVRKNMPGVSRGRALGCGDISPTVIARSEATWQSVTPAVGHAESST